MLWEVDIYPASGQIDRAAQRIKAEAKDLGLDLPLEVSTSHGYLIQGDLNQSQVDRIARELLADDVVQQTVVAPVGDDRFALAPEGKTHLAHVLPKPGVMDPVAQSAAVAIADFGIQVDAVRTFRKYWFAELPEPLPRLLCEKLLANDAIEQVVLGPLDFEKLAIGSDYQFELVHIPLSNLDDEQLYRLSRQGQLYLSLEEMQTIQTHFRQLEREPTDIELETIAQTWSEHCSHKTLAGRIAYDGPDGSGKIIERRFENMLKETIFEATVRIRQNLGDRDWCVSVFKDNAGIVRFDEKFNLVFKVETHNHPSALEPYGGANTGMGGVIRDPLGTGMGAKPICNTDVFCFAPPNTPAEALPPGVLHPRRVMQGVVSGVRDYGNRMGIPTVNGALYFDPRYLGNPLVYCGNVGLIPHDKSFKEPVPGDYVVVIGGRTGRDGIHGATFSSAELTHESEELSGGAVQIGNAITEKMVLDIVLAARDEELFNAITDCGAGGLSSAVGEMGEEIGAEVWLECVPLKYAGLSYTETWISEAQERMVFAVPPEKWERFHDLCMSEDVEATVIGSFEPTGRLVLKYHDHVVGDLTMDVLHNGRPPVVRKATYRPAEVKPFPVMVVEQADQTDTLFRILGSLNVASKHWVIRQYDHEVQGGSVIKPLVGPEGKGPSDAAVVRPVLDSNRGVVVACGMNPRYGDLDTYHMAASAIDEAIRNCVAVGADPRQIAILDNFCWGDTSHEETLGSLVRAALACYDLAVELETPFISGKDSLNNEFHFPTDEGTTESICIPPSLLISAMGQVADVHKCVTMDLKRAGNLLYLVGTTKDELGGSHLGLIHDLNGGPPPGVDVAQAKQTFLAMHAAIMASTVRACHDLSEGGLAVAVAEMAFAGGLGASIDLSEVVNEVDPERYTEAQLSAVLLYSESNTRFLCEVPSEHSAEFEQIMAPVPHARVGEVTEPSRVRIRHVGEGPMDARVCAIEADIVDLMAAWRSPMDW